MLYMCVTSRLSSILVISSLKEVEALETISIFFSTKEYQRNADRRQTVVVDPPELDVYVDLGEKLYEVRCKRDAVSLHHESLKRNNDTFNKSIIILSLVVAFVETLKSTLTLEDEEKYGYNIASLAKIAPIAISTLTAIISSLMKFKKFPERMELPDKIY